MTAASPGALDALLRIDGTDLVLNGNRTVPAHEIAAVEPVAFPRAVDNYSPWAVVFVGVLLTALGVEGLINGAIGFAIRSFRLRAQAGPLVSAGLMAAGIAAAVIGLKKRERPSTFHALRVRLNSGDVVVVEAPDAATLSALHREASRLVPSSRS